MVSPSKRKFVRGKPFVSKEEKNNHKLKLSYLPLLNKRFYLDVRNHRIVENIKRDLHYLGGVVEEFLEKDVNYVVTGQHLNPSSVGSSSENSCQQPSSNPFTPSPIAPHPQSFLSASCDSLNLESPKEDTRRKAKTRAEVLLEHACVKRQGTSDIIENARHWGIPVLSLPRLLKWIGGLKNSPLYKTPRNPSPSQKKLGAEHTGSNKSNAHPSRSQKLKAPFLKVEGFSREFRPQYKELCSWPSLNLNCEDGLSPFAEPKDIGISLKATPSHKDNYRERQRIRENKTNTKGGYCELCKANFTDLKLHLESANHQTFIKDNSNYARLDELISKYALNNLGETLYSGPYSQKKDGAVNNVRTCIGYPSTAGSQQEKKSVNNRIQATERDSAVEENNSTNSSPEVTGTVLSKESAKVLVTNHILPKSPVHKDSIVPISVANGLSGVSDDVHETEPLVLDKNSLDSVPFLSHNDFTGVDTSHKSSVTEFHNDKNLQFPTEPECVNNIFNNTKHCIDDTAESLEPASIEGCSCKLDGATEEDMVRLIQEPVSRVDSHSLRKGVRGSKRIHSVDGLDTLYKEKSNLRKNLNEKDLRNRRVSCQYERSDLDNSDDSVSEEADHSDMVDKLSKCKKAKNADQLNDRLSLVGCNSGVKLNGEVNSVSVNGVNNKIKARRISRTNSDDSDSVVGARVNGIDLDNDRVDINLLLEISATDRKRFESKKAKIKRKNADWMLITETEQYYNEKEEILKNKSREDTDSDSDSSYCSEKPKSRTISENKLPDTSDKCKALKKGSSEPKTSDEKNKISKKDSEIKVAEANAKKTPAKKGNIKSVLKKRSETRLDISSGDLKAEEKRTSRNKAYMKGTVNKFANSVLFHDDENSCEYKVTLAATKVNKGGKSFDTSKISQPRKRLSDAERFLRDNKEYYQFPETRDRLRRNVSYGGRDREDEHNSTHFDASDHIDSGINNQGKHIKELSPVKESSTKLYAKKSGSNRTEKKQRRSSECEKQQKSVKASEITETAQNCTGTGIEAVDTLYFSFEGAPVKESWYQTYQRYINGIETDRFDYKRESLRFVLPYEMPKEYFRDLQAKKSLLSRRRNELLDLVRKSPRCHASTLALFSDIFPGKKKKKSRLNKVTKSDDVSSDGTSTPVLEFAKLPMADYETDEEMLFIGQCMERVMKATIEENVASCARDIDKSKKRRDSKKISKKRAKGKKTLPPLQVEKFEFPSESKIFDNFLASEIDTRFLLGLPQYLEETSVTPEHTLSKDSLELLAESCQYECIDRTSCDEMSSADDRTEISSECLSVCGSETVDSSNSGFPSKFRKFGTYKKRRKNMTGWPTQKRKKPAPALVSDDNDSGMGFDDHKPKSRHPRGNVDQRRPHTLLVSPGRNRRLSTRKRSSVYYMDTWPVRFNNNK